MANPSLDLFQNNNVAQTTTDGSELGIGTLKGSFQTIFIWGDFTGGTVSIEVSPDAGVTWFATGITGIAAKTMSNLDVSHRNNALRIRAQISGTAVGVFAELR